MMSQGSLARNGRKEQNPSFQFYPGDFLSSNAVALMSNEAVGIYIKLLCRAWLQGGLPTSIDRLARLAQAPLERMAQAWDEEGLSECFEQVGDKLVNPRMERERRVREEFTETQKLRGQYGADIRLKRIPKGTTFEEWLLRTRESGSEGVVERPLSDPSASGSTSGEALGSPPTPSHPTPSHPIPSQTSPTEKRTRARGKNSPVSSTAELEKAAARMGLAWDSLTPKAREGLKLFAAFRDGRPKGSAHLKADAWRTQIKWAAEYGDAYLLAAEECRANQWVGMKRKYLDEASAQRRTHASSGAANGQRRAFRTARAETQAANDQNLREYVFSEDEPPGANILQIGGGDK